MLALSAYYSKTSSLIPFVLSINQHITCKVKNNSWERFQSHFTSKGEAGKEQGTFGPLPTSHSFPPRWTLLEKKEMLIYYIFQFPETVYLGLNNDNLMTGRNDGIIIMSSKDIDGFLVAVTCVQS